MAHLNRNSSGTIAALVLIIVALLGYQAWALRPAAFGPSKPTIIATFDLEKTLNSVDEKHNLDEERRKLAEELDAKSKDMAKALKELETELEAHVPGGKKHSELLDRLSQDTQYYRAYMEFCKAKLDDRRARNLKHLYSAAKAAADRLAQENNYAVIFVDDSISEVPLKGPEEVEWQISARRIVYTSPEVDITDALISRMNQEFAAAKPGSAAKTP